VAQSGQGSGTQSTSRQVGSALGIAILGTILFASLGGILSHRIDGSVDAATKEKVVTAVTASAGAAIPGLGRDPATQRRAIGP
jgi:hypothetical protein